MVHKWHAAHTKHLVARMEKHGWSAEELQEMHAKLSQDHENFTYRPFVQEIMHWLVFLLVVVATFTVGILLFPLQVILPNAGVYAVGMVMGFAFGLLFAVILTDMDHIFEVYHNLSVGILMPALAVITLAIMLWFADKYFANAFYETRHPIITGVIYVAALLLPYIILRFMKWSAKRDCNFEC